MILAKSGQKDRAIPQEPLALKNDIKNNPADALETWSFDLVGTPHHQYHYRHHPHAMFILIIEIQSRA